MYTTVCTYIYVHVHVHVQILKILICININNLVKLSQNNKTPQHWTGNRGI